MSSKQVGDPVGLRQTRSRRERRRAREVPPPDDDDHGGDAHSGGTRRAPAWADRRRRAGRGRGGRGSARSSPTPPPPPAGTGRDSTAMMPASGSRPTSGGAAGTRITRLGNEDDSADGGEGEPSFWERRGRTDTVESFVVASSAILSRDFPTAAVAGDMGHDLDAAAKRCAFTRASGPKPVRLERPLRPGTRLGRARGATRWTRLRAASTSPP